MVIAALTCGRYLVGACAGLGTNDDLNFQRGQNCGINVFHFFFHED